MYDAEFDGKVWDFGTSGFLFQSNKLMYDRQTNTLWHSLTGEPVIGPLAESDLRLELLPMTVATWSDWLELHPDSTVLSLDTGFDRDYLPPSEPGSAYFEYRNSPDQLFLTFNVDDRLPEKAMVTGVQFGDQARAYPIDLLAEELVVNDTVGGKDLVIVGHPTAGGARVYESQGVLFTPGEVPLEVLDQTGGSWRVEEESLVSEDGSRALPRLPARDLFWFGWTAFFPLTDLYEGVQSTS